jgi:hypothetical protein
MPEFRANVVYMAKTFKEALMKSITALENSVNKEPDFMFGNLKYNTGVILDDPKSATFYHIDKKQQTVTAVVFTGPLLTFAVKDFRLNFAFTPTSQAYVPNFVTQVDLPEFLQMGSSFLNQTLPVPFFRTYADHEIKEVMGKRSAKINKIEYANPNKASIHILDSSWYTTVMRTEGFMVTGHLRMQPCGKNLSERKLIYVDGFQKHGYVRKAKMLNQPSNNVV